MNRCCTQIEEVDVLLLDRMSHRSYSVDPGLIYQYVKRSLEMKTDLEGFKCAAINFVS